MTKFFDYANKLLAEFCAVLMTLVWLFPITMVAAQIVGWLLSGKWVIRHMADNPWLFLMVGTAWLAFGWILLMPFALYYEDVNEKFTAKYGKP